MLILINNNNSISVLSGTGGTNESIVYEDLSTEIQVLRSKALVSQALKHVKPPYENTSADMVVGNLYITQPNKTGILIVSYADTDPPRIKAVLDALGKTYIKYSSERKRSRATNAIELIEKQLPEAQKRLNESSYALRAFRQRYGLLDPESYGQSLIQRKQKLEADAQQARAALEQTQREYQEISRQIGLVGQDPNTAVTDSILSQDGGYQVLVGQLQELQSQLTRDRARFREDHPQIQDLKTRQQQVVSALEAQARLVLGNRAELLPRKIRTSISGNTQGYLANQLLQLRVKGAIEATTLKNISQNQAQIAARFQEIPTLQQNYIQLQDEFKRNTENVNNFLNKLQELRIAEAQDVSSWQVLEPAYVPGNPISPDYKKDLTMGLAMGALLGFGFALLWERLDRSIKTVDAVKQIAGIPLIGIVPKLSAKERYKGHINMAQLPKYQRSTLVESLRSIAISLRFWDSSRDLQTIAFTSALPQEGKTTLVYNLGLVLADLGQKVLLVDSNFYKPALHELIRESNEFGLSTVLETERTWHDAIYPNAARQKLDVMTSGPPIANPLSALLSEKMKLLLSEWKQAYDYVLIDTPAILSFTEAQSLAALVDGLILVVALQRCTPEAIARAREILQEISCQSLNGVVNFAGRNRGYQHTFSQYRLNYDNSILSPVPPVRDT